MTIDSRKKLDISQKIIEWKRVLKGNTQFLSLHSLFPEKLSTL